MRRRQLMALNTLAIDIGKHSFHLFGIDDDGVVVSRKAVG